MITSFSLHFVLCDGQSLFWHVRLCVWESESGLILRHVHILTHTVICPHAGDVVTASSAALQPNIFCFDTTVGTKEPFLTLDILE